MEKKRLKIALKHRNQRARRNSEREAAQHKSDQQAIVVKSGKGKSGGTGGFSNPISRPPGIWPGVSPCGQVTADSSELRVTEESKCKLATACSQLSPAKPRDIIAFGAVVDEVIRDIASANPQFAAPANELSQASEKLGVTVLDHFSDQIKKGFKDFSAQPASQDRRLW